MPRRKVLSLVLVLLALATPAAAGGTDVDPIVSPRVLATLARLFDPPAQSITIPNTFTNGTIADATQVNANFSALSSNALNRNGGTMLGTLNSRALTPTADATYDLGTAALRYRNLWTSGTTRFGSVTWTWPAADGTSGQALTTNGSGTLALATVQPPRGCDVRLTLTSGTPVTTTDVTGATSVYVTPYSGASGGPAYCGTYDGSSSWTPLPVTELTVAIGTLVAAQAYDVFAYSNSGVWAAETAEWANATITMTIAAPGVVTWTAHGMATGNSITFTTTGALPTGVSANTQYFITVVDANTFKLSTTLANVAAGTFITTSGTQSGTHTGHQPQARQTAVTLQNGVYVKSGTTTRRYLGSFLTTSTTTTEDSLLNRFVWNYYNRIERDLQRVESTGSWTYSAQAAHQANASASNQVSVLVGLAEDPVTLDLRATFSNSAGTSVVGGVGIGLNSTTTLAGNQLAQQVYNVTATGGNVSALYKGHPGLGLRIFTWLEFSSSIANAITWYGTSTAVGGAATTPSTASGLLGHIKG